MTWRESTFKKIWKYAAVGFLLQSHNKLSRETHTTKSSLPGIFYAAFENVLACNSISPGHAISVSAFHQGENQEARRKGKQLWHDYLKLSKNNHGVIVLNCLPAGC